MAQGLSPSIPFVTDDRDGIKLNKEYIDLVNQNLKMFFMQFLSEIFFVRQKEV